MPEALTPVRHQFGARNAVAAHTGCVVEQSQIGQRHGLLQVLQGARIARQDALWRHIVTALGHTLHHPAQQLTRVIHTHHQQHHGKTCRSRIPHQSQFGRMRKHRLAHKRLALRQTSGATRIGPSSGLGRTQFGIGDVLQSVSFVQVRIHKFGIGRQQARSNR